MSALATDSSTSNSRRQFARTDRLDHVIVGADVESLYSIALGRTRRQHDDRHGCEAGAASQDTAHLEAVEAGQVQVEDDQIRRMVAGRFQRRFAGVRDRDVDIARPVEGVFDERGPIGLVLDDEYAAAKDWDPLCLHRFRR